MIHKGSKPAGWHSTPEAWTYIQRGGKRVIAALMRRIDFDDSQTCLGDDLFIKDGPYGSDEKEYLALHCAGCPFLAPCGEYALAHEEHNYYAGMTAEDRKRARRELGVMLLHRDSADVHGLIPAARPAA